MWVICSMYSPLGKVGGDSLHSKLASLIHVLLFVSKDQPQLIQWVRLKQTPYSTIGVRNQVLLLNASLYIDGKAHQNIYFLLISAS